ncbi:MAG: PIN domain nuclease [Acidimicrobiaceae bacterium]|nr:PIN domain nuclease [Acidimicrobiaceae bacterium]
MILVDSSAWVEYLRATGSAAHLRVRTALMKAEIAVCDAISMEVLAGARNKSHLRDLNHLLARAVMLETLSLDYGIAASIHRACRHQGETPRSLIDCLIAAVAIRGEVTLLHADRDFGVIARHTTLRVISK